MLPEFYTFYIYGLYYLGFSVPLCVNVPASTASLPLLQIYWHEEQCPALYPLGSKHMINACKIKTANHVHILGRKKANCYRMRVSLVYSFVVVVLAPQRLLVFFTIFTYIHGREAVI